MEQKDGCYAPDAFVPVCVTLQKELPDDFTRQLVAKGVCIDPEQEYIRPPQRIIAFIRVRFLSELLELHHIVQSVQVLPKEAVTIEPRP